MIDVSKIEEKIDRAVLAPVPIKSVPMGITPENLGQVTELAKLMSVSGAAVPKYLRGNPGACLAIISRALRWQMDPYAVAEKSYIAYTQGGDERIAYESQLVHSVVIRWAPLKGRLRTSIIGEGDERRCKVSGTFIGESKPHEYTSETLAKLRDARGRNDKGRVKGSPLWDDQPEVQLEYSAVRTWARLNCPEVLLGVYTPEEIREAPMIDVNERVSDLSQRLRDTKEKSRKGFNVARINRTIEGQADYGKATGSESPPDDNASADDERGESRVGSQRTDLQSGGRAATNPRHQATESESAEGLQGARQKGAQAQGSRTDAGTKGGPGKASAGKASGKTSR